MKIPADALIEIEKLTHYLLVPRARNDKSKFLARAGFTAANPDALVGAIRNLSEIVTASEQHKSDYGTFYKVDGELVGVNNVNLEVATVWLKREIDGKFQFITLVPGKG